MGRPEVRNDCTQPPHFRKSLAGNHQTLGEKNSAQVNFSFHLEVRPRPHERQNTRDFLEIHTIF